MPPFVVGSGSSIMLSAAGLYVFSVPRSIFDALPGLESERVDDDTQHRSWSKDAVLLDSIDICFFCNEPPSPVRSDNQPGKI